MRSGGNSETSAVAALALAVHSSPARHAELLKGNDPLPPAVTVLLRLAGGTALHEFDPALASLAPERELRKAALFFIEQVLFQREATHYRVLGLNQDAAPDQVKEHHRLLMRLFHPDRESVAGERREQFATRANLAYNTLRDADTRARYDSTLKPSPLPPIQAPRRTPVGMKRRMPQPESFWTVRVYPLFMRYLPQWVLAGTALVSMAVVGGVYLFNPPVRLQQPLASSDAAVVDESALPHAEPEARVEMAAANITPLDEVVAQFEQRLADAALASERSPAAEAEASPPVQATVNEPIRIAVTVPPRPAPAAPAKPVQASPVKTVQKPVTVAVTPPAAPARIAAVQVPLQQAPHPAAPALAPAQPVASPVVAVAAAALPPVVVPAPRPAQPDPNTLLAQFLEAYEQGDMQACMAQLDEGLRTDAGGKRELRREFDALFRSTDLRHVKILTINWSRDGESIRGEGRYRATLMRKGETLLRSQDGQIRIELIRRGGTALINELYYLANNRP